MKHIRQYRFIMTDSNFRQYDRMVNYYIGNVIPVESCTIIKRTTVVLLMFDDKKKQNIVTSKNNEFSLFNP